MEAVMESQPELESAPEPEIAPDLVPEPLPTAPPARAIEFGIPVYLTAAESSVFVEGSVFTEPVIEDLGEDRGEDRGENLDEDLGEDLAEPHHPTE
jgi:hypothetical protein